MKTESRIVYVIPTTTIVITLYIYTVKYDYCNPYVGSLKSTLVTLYIVGVSFIVRGNRRTQRKP